MTRRVVLVGGGYVTLSAYRSLVRQLAEPIRRGRIEIVIISADDAHSFHGFTGEVLAGILAFERTRTPLREVCPLARVVHARVTHVDTARRIVSYERVDRPGRGELAYAELVIGAGGREPVGSVPGLAAHGYTLRAPGDIASLSARIRQVSSTLGEDEAGRTIAVAGGGLAGAELAAAIADVGAGHLRVVLVQSGARLLPALHAEQPGLAARAEHELRRLGVEVRLGVRLETVSAEGASLSDGSFLAAGTVVGAVGQAPVRIEGLGDSVRDELGRLVAADDLAVVDGVWSAGDAARVAHAVTGEPVPANALWAIKGGRHAGANVARALQGRATVPFTYRGLGQAASFGLGRSVAELYGIPFTGVLAWVLRLVFFLRFMPSRRRAVRVAIDMLRAVTSQGPVRVSPPAPTARTLALRSAA